MVLEASLRLFHLSLSLLDLSRKGRHGVTHYSAGHLDLDRLIYLGTNKTKDDQ